MYVHVRISLSQNVGDSRTRMRQQHLVCRNSRHQSIRQPPQSTTECRPCAPGTTIPPFLTESSKEPLREHQHQWGENPQKNRNSSPLVQPGHKQNLFPKTPGPGPHLRGQCPHRQPPPRKQARTHPQQYQLWHPETTTRLHNVTHTHTHRREQEHPQI